MTSDKKIATAMSGKTARACDCCIRKRARWYCPADDAFLCQSCDGSVHSANPLARRHERVRLKTASLERADDYNQRPDFPSWQRGLTRKPRTPRGGKGQQSKSEDQSTTQVVVPELDATSSQDGETEEQLLYQVPIFDPFVASEFRSPSTGYDIDIHIRPLEELEGGSDARKNSMFITSKSPMDEYMPSDMDLEEFAADVETLLGKGFDDESYAIEELGLLGCSPSKNNNGFINENYNTITGKVVKEENEFGNEGDIIRRCEIEGESNNVVIKDPLFELTFEYNDEHHHEYSAATCKEQEEEDEQKKVLMIEPCMVNELWKVKEDDEQMNKRRKMLLRLDYEAISEAWATQGSPWMNGQRPEINPNDCWPHCMGTCGKVHNQGYGENKNGGIINGCGNGGIIGDGGREARVLRYREKRRTRLFSKKIRYEVRKLNAEKRPRMKGRFVKRSTFAANTPALPTS